MNSVYEDSLVLHQQFQGKLGVQSLVPIRNRQDLALAYTPGVAEACRVIAQDPTAAYALTLRGRTVAVISDGSAVLGLGNIGAEAAMPVMEGKALLMKEFGGVDAFPLVIRTQETEEIIRFVQHVAPSFAGVNLEDISAPRCFEIEERLQDLGIPVFHDDQHGTAIVVYAALLNAAKVVGKTFSELRVVIVGAGAAGIATAKMLLGLEGSAAHGQVQQLAGVARVRDVIMVDSKGALDAQRTDLNPYKQLLVKFGNAEQRSGSLAEVIKGADVVIGVSGPGTITPEMVSSMAERQIVFAMANPMPEILPPAAYTAGAAVVATGRSDFPNQVNNVLAFPGIFRAVVAARLPRVTAQMKYRAAQALAGAVSQPSAEAILPNPFYPNLSALVADAVQREEELYVK